MYAANKLESAHESHDCLSGFLDEMIPLRGASHTDVMQYSVEIPTRYAQCFARLTDGRTVGFRNERLFVGWIGHRPCESLLFRSKGLLITLDVAGDSGRGPIRTLSANPSAAPIRKSKSHATHSVRKFIGIDGSLVVVPLN